MDLVRGLIRRSTARRTIEIRYTNYLQNAGVRPGSNTLAFTLETLGGLGVERVEVLPDSGLEVTRSSPARLVLEPVLSDRKVRVGEQFEIGFELRNEGDLAARDVVIGIAAPAAGLTVRPPAARRYPRVTGTVSGEFQIRAKRPGRHRLVLATQAANANQPEAVIEAPIAPAELSRRGSASVDRRVIAGLLVLTGLVLIAGRSWRRSRT